MKKTLTITLNPEEIEDIITTAEEGGINYWADAVCHGRGSRKDLFWVREDEEAGSKVYTLKKSEMSSALNKLFEKYPHLQNNCMFDLEGEQFEADADGADSIIQIMCFGELVYG